MLDLIRQLKNIDPQLEVRSIRERKDGQKTKITVHVSMAWKRPIPRRILTLLRQPVLAESENEAHQMHDAAMDALRHHVRLAILNNTAGAVNANVLKEVELNEPARRAFGQEDVDVSGGRRTRVEPNALTRTDWERLVWPNTQPGDRRASGLPEKEWKNRRHFSKDESLKFNAHRTPGWKASELPTSPEAATGPRSRRIEIVLETAMPTGKWKAQQEKVGQNQIKLVEKH